MFSIKEVLDNYQNACVKKATSSIPSLFVKAMFAGAMIGAGAAAGNVASHAISNVGVSRMAAAVVFPVGLMMVVFMGAELFTGDCLAAIGVAGKKITMKDLLKIFITVYLGNMVGATILTGMIYLSGQFDYSGGLLGAYSIKVALGKTSLSFSKGLFSGILCNILVCAAVLMANAAKDAHGKLLACFFVIFLFVTSGYEHCVANMYYITAGLFAKLNPAYVDKAIEAYGYTSEQLSNLSLYGYFVKNLIPVTIGNILGGAAFLGLPLFVLNKDK